MTDVTVRTPATTLRPGQWTAYAAWIHHDGGVESFPAEPHQSGYDASP
jgi:hypothetical protein